jgi:uncharacterized protein (TIGR02217 family)
MAGRVSQETIEPLVSGSPNARVSQETLEPLVAGSPNARVSQIIGEPIVTGTPAARVSQQVIEAILNANPGLHVSQIVLEILCYEIALPMPLVYPTLPGLAYPVDWDTAFFNADTQRTSTGAEIDIGLSQYPLHTFGLEYEFAREHFGFNEHRLLRGFFGATRGNLVRFLFRNEDDFRVRRQAIATTDGSTRSFTLIRTYGVGEASFSEPVGYVDQTAPFNVYLDDVLQDPSSYTIDTTVPVSQLLVFNGVPTTGHAVTVDMDYFYYCKFADPKISLQKFMNELWSGDKIILKSCRPGA